MNTTFRCPRCGGRYFGTILEFVPDDAFPLITSRREAMVHVLAGRALIVGQQICPENMPDILPDEDDFTEARVLKDIKTTKYRCHSTSDGTDDVTAGAAHIEFGSHAVFLGAQGRPCGWEGTPIPSRNIELA